MATKISVYLEEDVAENMKLLIKRGNENHRFRQYIIEKIY